MLGTSGIRGKYGDNITPSLIYQVSNKFSQDKNKIYIGKDIRPSSPALYYSAIAGALAAGARVYMLDTVPTGIIGFAGSGIMITASHNPEHDNGIKFFSEGVELTKEDAEFLIKELKETGEGIATSYQSNIYEKYLDKLIEYFDFKISEPIDLNSAAYSFFNYYIAQTRDKLKLINNTPYFLRNSEPIQENVMIDRGYMLDGDGDRVVLIRNGKILDGDRMFAALAKYMHETRGTDVLAVTVECPMKIKKYLSNYYNKTIITKVGSNYIAKELKNYRFRGFGGEPNGHYIIPAFNLSSDGIAGMALIDEFIRSGGALPEINYKVIRKKYKTKDKYKTIENIKNSIDEEYNDIDGILIEKDDYKVLIRASGTEEIIRLTVEAENPEILEKYEKIILNNIKN